MKIVIEDKIPFIRGILEKYADILYLPSDRITPHTVNNADALIVRTRNRCDASLLDESKCRFIASATIGLDHIDMDYCRKRRIKVVNAPGCNAPAVAQYVLASLLTVIPDPAGLTLGIVGVGNIGKIVANWAEDLGMKVLLNDPPRQKKEGSASFVPIKKITEQADIITFHTPLVKDGPYPTLHLLNDEFIGKLKKNPVIINAARGPIVDTAVLIEGLKNKKIRAAMIDCWENEPHINPQLLQMAAVATPHIAGYSLEGKIRATRMVVEQLARHFDLPDIDWENELPPVMPHIDMSVIKKSYDPLVDSQALKADLTAFETLRNNYSYRHEPTP